MDPREYVLLRKLYNATVQGIPRFIQRAREDIAAYDRAEAASLPKAA